METRPTHLISTTLQPKFIYACRSFTGVLSRTNLLTGEPSCLQIHGYKFNEGCRWSELPGGSLLITGGVEEPAVSEVVKIDTLKEYAVSALPPMRMGRYSHAAVYHSQYFYVLGGCSEEYLSECERYVCADSRWEELPALPVACFAMSAVELDNSLYTLGGHDESKLDTVQKLSLNSLTWELMQLKLPQAACYLPCFKTDTEVYLVIDKTLYSFTPLQVTRIKSVQKSFCCNSSYYSRGSLYYSFNDDIGSLAVGELTSL
jgi:hypothetical protein